MNRGIYKFNDALDRAAVKPATKAYQKITPNWFRTGVRNFFTHLETPWTIVNQVLQGKPQLAAQDTSRFVLNTVVGLGGLINVSSKLGLEDHDEDFGQTLAVWGVPSGPYLVLPGFGPSTLRDGVGRVPDFLSNPTRYGDIPWETKTVMTTLDVLQTREGLLSLDEAMQQAYDPYGLMRDAWLQRREYVIFDGNPPAEDLGEADLDAELNEPMSNEIDAKLDETPTTTATPPTAAP
jgi:phospholipid-binding lipoprotein MlaA